MWCKDFSKLRSCPLQDCWPISSIQVFSDCLEDLASIRGQTAPLNIYMLKC